MGRILVVDDDVMVRRVIRMMLERDGHQVAEAADGIEGLESFESDPPHVVLTDIQMPRMNGFEMMLEMHRRRPDVPLIAMSGGGHASPEHSLLLAKDLGAAHTLSKPLDARSLLSAVRRLSTPLPS